MSYQLIKLLQQNTLRKITDGNPLVIDFTISANDVTTLKMGIVVASFSGAGTAAMKIQETLDGGVSWADIVTSSDTINGTGTFKITVENGTGIISPSLRLVITPTAGVTVYLSQIFRTFSTGELIVPRPSLASTLDFGTTAGGLRAAAIPGNESGIADFGAGVPTAQTLRVAVASGGGLGGIATEATLATIAGYVDGVEALITAANVTLASILSAVDQIEGYTDQIETILTSGVKPEYSAAFAPVSRDFSSVGLTANVWSELIASTSAKAILLRYLNDSGEYVEIGFGAGGAEVSQDVMGTSGEILLHVPAGTRVSLRCASNVSVGKMFLSAFV